MFDALARATDSIAARLPLLRRVDAWYNEVTGFGTTRDKTTYGRAAFGPVLSVEDLDALYNYNDMAARIVDIVPDDVYSLGFGIETGEPALDEVLKDKFDALAVPERFADGMRWGRVFGGGAVLIGADDGKDASLPLNIERAEDIKYLYDFDRRVLHPNTFYTDFGNPKMGQTETYLVWNQTQTGGAQIVVHESRLIMFGGATTGRQEKLLNQGWDLSVLQRPHEVLRQFDTGWKSVEILLTDAHQTVMKMSGLADIVGSPGGMETLQRRAMLTDLYRSVMRAIVIDAGTKDEPAESMERQAVSFEAIPQVLDKVMIRMSAAADVPVTRLMGQSPAGLSATGESDLRWHYGRMESERTRRQEPKVRQLALLWLQTRAGKAAAKTLPKSINVKWPSLWNDTPLNEATRRKTIAETDAIYITAQAFTPDEVALTRGRPDGWEKDVALSDEGVKARETALASDLEDLGNQSEAIDETPTQATKEDPAQRSKAGTKPPATPRG